MDSGRPCGIFWHSERGQTLQVGIQDRPDEPKIRIPAFPLHLDQARLAEFLHVVGDRRWAEDVMLLKPAARHAFRRSHLVQDGEPVRIGKCPADGAKLRFRQHHVRIGAL